MGTSNQSNSTLSSTIRPLTTTPDGHINSAQMATTSATMTPEAIATGNQIKVLPQGLDKMKGEHILTQPQGSEVIKAFEKGSDFANGLYDPVLVYEKLQDIRAKKLKIKLTPSQIEAIKKGSETHIYVDQNDTFLSSLERLQGTQETPTTFSSSQESSPKLVESTYSEKSLHFSVGTTPSKENDLVEKGPKLYEETSGLTTASLSTSSLSPKTSVSNSEIKTPSLNEDLLVLLEILRQHKAKRFSSSSSPSLDVPSSGDDEAEDLVEPPLDPFDLLTNKQAKDKLNHLTSPTTPRKVVAPSQLPRIASSTLSGFAEFPTIEPEFQEQTNNIDLEEAKAFQTKSDNLNPGPLTTGVPSHPFSEGEKRNVPFGLFSSLEEEPPFEPDKEETRSKNTRPLTMAHLEQDSPSVPENGVRDLKSCCSLSVGRVCFLIAILVFWDLV